MVKAPSILLPPALFVTYAGAYYDSFVYGPPNKGYLLDAAD
jgi:hypothetical protein